MELQNIFQEAVNGSRLLTKKPTNENLLQLYSLYKQSTEGDNENTPPSNPFDVVAKVKHKAWESQKGKSKEIAKQEYIDLVEKLKSGN